MARSGFQRFEYNSPGYIAIMKSGPVQAILEAKGRRVAAAISPRLSDLDDWEVIVSSRVGTTRARTIVSGVPTSIEEREAILGSAIDAARG